jgi:hypothetical protein
MESPDDVYFIEDFSLNDENIRLTLFNVSAFYRTFAELYEIEFEELINMQRIPNDDVKKYVETFISIDEAPFFKEEYVSKDYEFMFWSFSAEYVLLTSSGIINVNQVRDYNNRPNKVKKKAKSDANFFRLELKKRLQPPTNFIKKSFCAKKAAIVNVGFGNCCILFDEESVVMIDGSIKETYRSHSFQVNMDAAIDWVKKEQKKDFHVDTFLLTHPHYDHYSGVCHLMKYMDDKTDFYINCYYSQTIPTYTKILAALYNSNIRIVNPIISNSTNGVEILHPNSSFTKCTRLNNASVLSSIAVTNQEMIFPGDIENSCTHEGWNIVCANIKNKIKNVGYYMLSHHGSSNGCDLNAIPTSPFLTFCSTRQTRRFPTIPDNNTLSLFKNCKRTDSNNCKYIKVDFFKQTCTYR